MQSHVNRHVTFPLYRSLRGKKLENQTCHHENAVFWEPLAAPLLLKKPRLQFFIQSNSALFPNDKYCRILTKRSHPVMRKTSRPYEMVFSARVKTDPENTLRRHIVDVKEANAAFRKAPGRQLYIFCQQYYFHNNVLNRLTEQKKLSVYNWNPGPRRRKKERSKNTLRRSGTLSPCKKQLNTSTTSDESLPCDTLDLVSTRIFSFLTSKSRPFTFTTRGHQQDNVKERESGWVLQGVISRATFRRQPRGGKSFFAVMSLHINNNFRQKARRKEATPYNSRCDARRACGLGCWGTSTGPLGAAGAVTGISVLSKKLSPTQICDATWHHTFVGPRCSAK